MFSELLELKLSEKIMQVAVAVGVPVFVEDGVGEPVIVKVVVN